MWDVDQAGYVDRKTQAPLLTWAQAEQALGTEGAEPAYVARLGSIDPREMKGIEVGTKDAERAIQYVTKYVTKNLADQATPRGDAARAHFDRLHAELAVLPCTPACANRLRYGIQPDKSGARPGAGPVRRQSPSTRHSRLHRPPYAHLAELIPAKQDRPSGGQPGLGQSHPRRRPHRRPRPGGGARPVQLRTPPTRRPRRAAPSTPVNPPRAAAPAAGAAGRGREAPERRRCAARCPGRWPPRRRCTHGRAR